MLQNSSAQDQNKNAMADRLPPLGPNLKALMIWPRFPASFWTFAKIMEILPKKANQPPLGLLTVAALCPSTWELRLIDCTFEDLNESDLLWADLVMVSGMHVQKADIHAILRRARALGRRTIIGGPYASSVPEEVTPLADHVVVGEPDDVFGEIAADLEDGTARPLYVIDRKPDITHTPAPRFDLLRMDNYISMAVQFSRGCPYQCEFCDIITIYGRKPRTKTPAQMLAELEALHDLGWRDQVFVVDDNFIGNHKRALELALSLGEWQRAHDCPFFFFTEASIDLAQRPELIDAMVRANFFYVFVGIESPLRDSLAEAKKLQNLRRDPLECIRFIQSRGLWVTAGFIVGFDSDPESIFELQRDFIEQAAIPWAMAGLLQAPPTTPLYERVRKEGRLIESSRATTNFSPPNFHTRLPLPLLLKGYRDTLAALYSPEGYYRRSLNSLLHWKSRKEQRVTLQYSLLAMAATVLRSVLHQGILSSYRREYWKFTYQILTRWSRNRSQLRMGLVLLFSGHHFINFAQRLVAELDAEIEKLAADTPGCVESCRERPLAGRLVPIAQ